MEKLKIMENPGNSVAFARYDYNKEIFIIGGHQDCIDFIESIITRFIQSKIPKNTHSQRARIRYKIRLSREKYRKFKNKASEHFGELFEKIANLDRRL